MEHVVVRCDERREVLIDDNASGWTDDTLDVEEGHHLFRLGGPQDYQPSLVEEVVTGTTVITPMVIVFTRPQVVPENPASPATETEERNA